MSANGFMLSVPTAIGVTVEATRMRAGPDLSGSLLQKVTLIAACPQPRGFFTSGGLVMAVVERCTGVRFSPFATECLGARMLWPAPVPRKVVREPTARIIQCVPPSPSRYCGRCVGYTNGEQGKSWDYSAPSNRHPSRTCPLGTGRRNGTWHRAIADRIAASNVCWLPREPSGSAGKVAGLRLYPIREVLP